MNERLQALRELAEKATPGPWDFDWNDLTTVYVHGGPNGGQRVAWTARKTGEDAKFISAVNPRTLTALLDVVEKANRMQQTVHRNRDGWTQPSVLALDELATALDNLNNLLETENGGEG